MARRNGNHARARVSIERERESERVGGGERYYPTGDDGFFIEKPNKGAMILYEDFKGALMAMLYQSAPRELDDTVNSACHLAGIAVKTAKENYLPRLTSTYGPFLIYKEQGTAVIDFRREIRNGHPLH